MSQRNGGFDFQSRRFFTFTKIYDNLHGHSGIKEVNTMNEPVRTQWQFRAAPYSTDGQALLSY